MPFLASWRRRYISGSHSTWHLYNPLFVANERQASQIKLLLVIPAIQKQLNTVQPDKLDTGFCHGDCHGSNVHNDNGLLTQFDFEDCAIGFRAYDIATFKWAIRGEHNEKDLWPSFLKGYHSVRQPGVEDLKSIPVFVAIRQLWWIAFIIRNLPDFGHNDAGGNFICTELSRIQGMLEAGDN